MIFSTDIEKQTLDNTSYRKVLHTTDESQLVVMSVNSGEYIPAETHDDGTQFIRVESGKGVILGDGTEVQLSDGMSAMIPNNTSHHIKNVSNVPLKLYTLYSPPEHPAGRIDVRQIDSNVSRESDHSKVGILGVVLGLLTLAFFLNNLRNIN